MYKRLSKQIMSKAACTRDKEILSRRDALLRLGGLAGATMIAGGWSSASAASVQANMNNELQRRNVPMYAYVGCRTTRERNARGNGINVYRVDPATGDWTHTQLVDGLVNPSFFTFGHNQRFLYSVHGDQSEVSAFGIDPQDGRLMFINKQSTGGKNPVHLTVDASNRFLAIANYGSGSVALLPVRDDGSLGELADLVDVPGKPGPHRAEQPHARPHHIPFDRAGRFLIVPDKGLDKIFTFKLDAERAKLILQDEAVKTRETAGPRHVDFHPVRPFAYVINELDSTVTTYRYDTEHGSLKPLQILSALPDTFTGDSRASEIAVDPAGRFVYASNRGHDSIAIFSIDQKTGLLSNAGWEPSQGKTPRFFSIDPSSRFLYVANEDSDAIATFRIDPEQGRLMPTGQMIKTGSPVCILFSGR
jgi:6-phosphogluconolactonase (cycloisomerase 2 family)